MRELVKGKAYMVNGTLLYFRWSKYSVNARQVEYHFSCGYFSSGLYENDLEKFVTEYYL